MELTQIGDIIREMIFLYDENGKIISYNKAARAHLLLYAEEKGPEMMSDILPQIFSKSGEKPKEGEKIRTVMYRSNETCFPVDIWIHQADRGHFLCVGINRTGQNELIRQVELSKEESLEALKYKNEFVSNITHELRTPINGMMGLIQSLLDTNLSPNQIETVRLMEQCSKNMSKIINDLLDFSKLESGKFTLEEKNFVFRDFLNKTMAFHVKSVNEKGLKLILRVDDEIPGMLCGDELRLNQILSNLISNAVKFTSVGFIAVEVSKTMETEDTVELFFMVIDTGIGISEEGREKLFQSFTQVDASITRRFGGTGLGLAICKQLVEMMGGRIRVEGEEGKGSTFSFYVNLKKVQEPFDNEWENDVRFPSGKFEYHGSGSYDRKENGDGTDSDWDYDLDLNEVYQFGTEANLKEIKDNMEKFLICLDLGNWGRAENFAGVIKGLISEDYAQLKREAFRLELLTRKENQEKVLKQYEILNEKLSEVDGYGSDENS